jgi:hypothetical protein
MSKRFIYYGSFASATWFSDDFGMPASAYSLRKLTPNATNCIRVRRSSDNAEQNIGFVANVPNSPIDTTALLAFVGAGNGFVTTWYDQSTNANNAIQTTANAQVRIVSSGNIDVDNIKAALNFNGSQFLQLTSTISTGKIMSVFSVTNNNNKSVAVMIGSTSPISNYNSDNLNHTLNAAGAFAQVGGFQYGQRIRTILRNNSTTNEVFQNNTLFTLTVTNNDFTIKEIGRRADLTNFLWLGWMQELIIYTNAKSSDRTAIETNQNTYYNVF